MRRSTLCLLLALACLTALPGCRDHEERQEMRRQLDYANGYAQPTSYEDCALNDGTVLEEQVLYDEQRRAVAAAMEQLEDDFRLILTLRVVENLPYEEIASIMDLKVGTVKSRLARARNKLKKILLQSGNNLSSHSSNTTEGGMRHEL